MAVRHGVRPVLGRVPGTPASGRRRAGPRHGPGRDRRRGARPDPQPVAPPLRGRARPRGARPGDRRRASSRGRSAAPPGTSAPCAPRSSTSTRAGPCPRWTDRPSSSRWATTSSSRSRLGPDGGFTWVAADAADAESGLANGEYAAVLTVPADFSQSVATIRTDTTGTAPKATLRVSTDDGSGYTLGTVARAVTAAIGTATAQDITASYVDDVLVQVTTARDALTGGRRTPARSPTTASRSRTMRQARASSRARSRRGCASSPTAPRAPRTAPGSSSRA